MAYVLGTPYHGIHRHVCPGTLHTPPDVMGNHGMPGYKETMCNPKLHTVVLCELETKAGTAVIGERKIALWPWVDPRSPAEN